MQLTAQGPGWVRLRGVERVEAVVKWVRLGFGYFLCRQCDTRETGLAAERGSTGGREGERGETCSVGLCESGEGG